MVSVPQLLLHFCVPFHSRTPCESSACIYKFSTPRFFFKSISSQVSHLRVQRNNSCDNRDYPHVPFITQSKLSSNTILWQHRDQGSLHPLLGFLDPTVSSSSSYFTDGHFLVSFAGFSSYKLLKFHSPFLCGNPSNPLEIACSS